jgi:hypothetical protein
MDPKHAYIHMVNQLDKDLDLIGSLSSQVILDIYDRQQEVLGIIIQNIMFRQDRSAFSSEESADEILGPLVVPNSTHQQAASVDHSVITISSGSDTSPPSSPTAHQRSSTFDDSVSSQVAPHQPRSSAPSPMGIVFSNSSHGVVVPQIPIPYTVMVDALPSGMQIDQGSVAAIDNMLIENPAFYTNQPVAESSIWAGA